MDDSYLFYSHSKYENNFYLPILCKNVKVSCFNHILGPVLAISYFQCIGLHKSTAHMDDSYLFYSHSKYKNNFYLPILCKNLKVSCFNHILGPVLVISYFQCIGLHKSTAHMDD